MSERMIEIQRAKLGLSSSSNNHSSSARQQHLSPAEVAGASLLSEDAKIERFINRLQRRDRKNINAQHYHSTPPPSSGPTVPTALSRRMLQRQGVGFLDDTVASVVSASADRFLATVLQQSIACRDQRLKGAAMTREGAKQLKRHIEGYDADNDDRKRRKEAILKAREDIALITIAEADAIKKGSGGIGGGGSKSNSASGGATDKKPTKKKKKGTKTEPAKPAPASGPGKLDPAMESLAMEESEEEYDSIDEEEEYYQENVVGVTRERIRLKKTGGSQDEDDEEDEENEDEDDDTLLLRDIVRPLEAWNFHLNGKEAIETDDDNDDEDIENHEGMHENGSGKPSTDFSAAHAEQFEDNNKGRSENYTTNVVAIGAGDGKQQGNEKKQGDAAANGNKNGGAKKAGGASAAASASSSGNNNTPASS